MNGRRVDVFNCSVGDSRGPPTRSSLTGAVEACLNSRNKSKSLENQSLTVYRHGSFELARITIFEALGVGVAIASHEMQKETRHHVERIRYT